jgi:PAS domain S-box-containing protein
MRKKSLLKAILSRLKVLAYSSGKAVPQGHPAKVSNQDASTSMPASDDMRTDERQFRLFVDAIPPMIWIVDANGKCVHVNKPWLAFTGRPIDQELGDGWATSIHPDYKEKTLATFEEAFAGRHRFKLEYRVKCGDGEYRWLLLNGTQRFGENGEFAGMIAAGTDITDLRSAEDELLDLSGRLINAHEKERSRIARELHDDLSQQMALLSIDLEQLAQRVPDASPEISRSLGKALQRAQDVSSELHRISYEIHPAKLDRLGLAAASLSLCREVSKQQSLRLECTFKDIPDPLPRDISLCLYRVLQEAVRNIVKHSGACHAQVELSGTPSEVRLRISDEGVGFSLDSVGNKGGMGLLNMRERLRIVGGTISIDSQPLRGTTITATVPLPAVKPAFALEAVSEQKCV